MHDALLTAYLAMPEPRRVAALGNCALGCYLLGHPGVLVGADILPTELNLQVF
jgi:Ni,Fe-hydrogenase III small subunit